MAAAEERQCLVAVAAWRCSDNGGLGTVCGTVRGWQRVDSEQPPRWGTSAGFCPNAVETKTDLQDHQAHCSRFSLYEKRKNMETRKFNGGGALIQI